MGRRGWKRDGSYTLFRSSWGGRGGSFFSLLEGERVLFFGRGRTLKKTQPEKPGGKSFFWQSGNAKAPLFSARPEWGRKSEKEKGGGGEIPLSPQKNKAGQRKKGGFFFFSLGLAPPSFFYRKKKMEGEKAGGGSAWSSP